jgi:Flp pilus assembly protein TadD
MTDMPASSLDALDADELLMLGLRANVQGKSDSLGYFKLAVARNPLHAKAHWALATEYASLRMPDRAREHFARAVELDPGQPVARFQYGLLCLTQGDVAQAETLWKPLDGLDAENPVRLFKQGLLHMVADRFDDALALIRRAMASPGVDPALQRDMAMTVDNIEAAMRQPPGGPRPVASNEPELPIESHLALSAYRGGSSGSH